MNESQLADSTSRHAPRTLRHRPDNQPLTNTPRMFLHPIFASRRAKTSNFLRPPVSTSKKANSSETIENID